MKSILFLALFSFGLSPIEQNSLCIETASCAPLKGAMQDFKVIWFKMPDDNAQSSWLKKIDNPTPQNPKAMKRSIYFEEQKITFVDKNGVVRDYMNKAELVDEVKMDNEKPRIWKIPNPKATPKDENDFVATFQIFKKGIVLTFKDGSNPMVFTLKA